MSRRPPALASCALAVLLACVVPASGASREECERQYQPEIGQPGKDVMWVPTADGLVARMLKMAQVTSADRVYDLGAGDGKIAIAAARDFGAQAVGVEYEPRLARLAQCYVQAAGLGERVRIVHGDVFQTDFSAATVVTLYLLPELNLRLRPTLLKMKPGTRVVSHSFLMDDWEPDERSMTEDGSAYLWIVPANVAGAWEFRESDGQGRFTTRIEQKFQHLSGRAGEEALISSARVRGSQIDLMFFESGGPTKVAGTVAGDRIDAQVTRAGKTSRYIGTRSQSGSGKVSPPARPSMLAQFGAHAPRSEYTEVLSDLGVGREQPQLLLVDLVHLIDRGLSLFGDGFFRGLVILGVGERSSRGGHREKPPNAS